jgi:4-hydroxybenzoyl-CoA thioesterase/acyl-CoA thioester hydrolase
MSQTYRTNRRIEFCETDAAGIAHFSAYFQYMEQAEHSLLRHVGLSVVMDDGQGTIGWPRVSASCDYQGAVRFEEVVDLDVVVARIGERSITYDFTFHLNGEEVARGQLTSVCCRILPGEKPHSMPIPSWFSDRLRPFVR